MTQDPKAARCNKCIDLSRWPLWMTPKEAVALNFVSDSLATNYEILISWLKKLHLEMAVWNPSETQIYVCRDFIFVA